jgi:hypothetical protein
LAWKTAIASRHDSHWKLSIFLIITKAKNYLLSVLNLLNQIQIVFYSDACFCVVCKPQLYQHFKSPQTTPFILTENCSACRRLTVLSLSSLDLHFRIILRFGQQLFCNFEHQSFIFPLVPLSDFVCVAVWHAGVFFWSMPTKPLSGVELSVADPAHKCFGLIRLHLANDQFLFCCLGWLCLSYWLGITCRHLSRVWILEHAPDRDWF